MKKAMKKAKQKAGRFTNDVLLSSRSESPAPADRDWPRASSLTPLPPEQPAETVSQPGQISAEPAAIRQPSQIVGAPRSAALDRGSIPPTPSLVKEGHADPQARQAGSKVYGSVVGELSDVSHLAPNLSLSRGPVSETNT